MELQPKFSLTNCLNACSNKMDGNGNGRPSIFINWNIPKTPTEISPLSISSWRFAIFPSLNLSYVDDYRIYNLWKLNLIRLIFQFVKILIFSIRDRLSSIIQALPITGRLFWINTATHVQKLYIRKASWSIFIRSFTVNWRRGQRFRVTTVDISLTERKKIHK